MRDAALCVRRRTAGVEGALPAVRTLALVLGAERSVWSRPACAQWTSSMDLPAQALGTVPAGNIRERGFGCTANMPLQAMQSASCSVRPGRCRARPLCSRIAGATVRSHSAPSRSAAPQRSRPMRLDAFLSVRRRLRRSNLRGAGREWLRDEILAARSRPPVAVVPAGGDRNKIAQSVEHRGFLG
jgi:hypothetical protein